MTIAPEKISERRRGGGPGAEPPASQRWRMFGFIALCVGLIFAIPVVWLSAVVAYRWMQYGRRAIMDHPGTEVPMIKPG